VSAAIDALPAPTLGSKVGSVYHPGEFNIKIEISGSGIKTFMPGIYWLNNDLKIEGSVQIVAHGVLFIIASGNVDIGSGPHAIGISAISSPRSLAEDLAGVAIYQPESNKNTFLQGDSAHAGVRVGDECNLSPNVNPPGSVPPGSGIAGGIYLPGTTLRQRGNGSTFCATRPIVAKKIRVE